MSDFTIEKLMQFNNEGLGGSSLFAATRWLQLEHIPRVRVSLQRN